MADGKRPLSVGLFLSLGHSTIVLALALRFAIGLRSLDGQIRNGGSTLHSATGLIGTGVSGAFLYLIAVLNAVITIAPHESSVACSLPKMHRPTVKHPTRGLDLARDLIEISDHAKHVIELERHARRWYLDHKGRREELSTSRPDPQNDRGAVIA